MVFPVTFMSPELGNMFVLSHVMKRKVGLKNCIFLFCFINGDISKTVFSLFYKSII